MDFTGDETLATEGDTSAATQSFRTLMDLSTRGGHGAIHTENFETVVVGRLSPPCALFPKLGAGEAARGYKGFALDEFAEVKNADRFPDLLEALGNRAHLATLHSPNEGGENPGAEAVMEAFQELEMAGKTRRFQGLEGVEEGSK